MKTKYNLFSSIFSLCATLLLLVCIVMAWYITNQEAKVTGITATTANDQIWDITLDRYIAVSNDDGTYTYDSANNLSEPGVTVNPFDFIAVHDLIIYKITFKTTMESVSLTMKNTNSSRSEKFTGTQTGGADTPDDESDDTFTYHNYLSNVANFYYLLDSGTDTPKLTVTKYSESDEKATYKEFTYSGDIASGDSQIGEVSLLSVDAHSADSTEEYTEVSVYFLFDYDTVDINRLFTANLGTAGANSRVYFREDIEFILG